MLIGELAKETNVSIDTIRYYEREGLIKPTYVRESGYRDFDSSSVKTIGFVVRAKGLGFALKEIRNLLDLKNTPDTTCSNVRTLAEQKLKDVTGKIKALHKIETELKTLIKECTEDNRGSEACPIVINLDKGNN